jgi:hypothetical protein
MAYGILPQNSKNDRRYFTIWRLRRVVAAAMVLVCWKLRLKGSPSLSCFVGGGEDSMAATSRAQVCGTFRTWITFHGLRLLRQAGLEEGRQPAVNGWG